MLANAAELVWLRSWVAQGDHLRLSPRASVSVGEQPLYVLSCGDEQGLGKQRFDPHLALPQRLAVGFGVAVTSHLLEVLLIEAAPDPTSLLLALRASSPERAGVAGIGPSGIPGGSLLVVAALSAQSLTLRARIGVAFGVVDEVVLAEEGTAFVVVG